MGLDKFTGSNSDRKTSRVHKTDDELLDAMKQFYIEYGKITAPMFKADPDYPSSSTVISRFGSWNNAMREAGLPINKKGGSTVYIEDINENATEHMAYSIGVMLGDGGVYAKNTSTPHIRLTAKDSDFVAAFAESVCMWFDLEWYGWDSDKSNISCSGPHELTGNRNNVYTVTKSIDSELYNYIKDILNSDYTDILDACNGYEVDLIRGLWDSEGSFEADRSRFTFTTTDSNIHNLYVEAVSRHLEFQDKELYITQYDPGDGFTSDTAYRVVVPSKYARIFKDSVKPSIQRKFTNP